MKIKEEFYVLIKLRVKDKGHIRTGDTKETLFYCKKDGEDFFVDNIKEATRCNDKYTAFLILRDYEEKHGCEPSGLVPLLVTSEWTY